MTNSRTMTVELVRRENQVVWQVDFSTGGRRYISSSLTLGDVILGLCRLDGDTVVVMPAGYSLTYSTEVKGDE